MIYKYFIIPLSFVIWACGSNHSEKASSVDSLQMDSIGVQIVSGVFPILINDSTTRDSVTLPSTFIRKYILPLGDKITDRWMIEKFLQIDSLKSVGKYNEYVEKLDIGDTKDAYAWVYDTLSFSSGKAYIWGLSFQSFEACPYYSGKKIYLTTVSSEGIHKSTIQLTDISAGGDPPSFGSNSGVCRIERDLKISCQDTSLSGEYGDDGYEDIVILPVTRTYEVTGDGTIKVLSEVKSPEIKKRRKGENE